MKQLRVRIDDVLVNSASFNPDIRYVQITEWLEKTPLIKHVPAILVKDIQQFPQTVDLVVKKTEEGKMFPILHGWEHVDYNKLSENEIREHLSKSMDWFEKTFKMTPDTWATPWGAESEKLTKVAAEFGIVVEGTRECVSPGEWLASARKQLLDLDKTVMEHWWTRGLRLLRVAYVLKHGSYTEAVKSEKIF